MPSTFPRAATPPDRTALRARFERDRARTRALFDLIDESAYGARPIPLRNPVVFYEGHLPAFAVNTLVKRALDAALGARLKLNNNDALLAAADAISAAAFEFAATADGAALGAIDPLLPTQFK